MIIIWLIMRMIDSNNRQPHQKDQNRIKSLFSLQPPIKNNKKIKAKINKNKRINNQVKQSKS